MEYAKLIKMIVYIYTACMNFSSYLSNTPFKESLKIHISLIKLT